MSEISAVPVDASPTPSPISINLKAEDFGGLARAVHLKGHEEAPLVLVVLQGSLFAVQTYGDVIVWAKAPVTMAACPDECLPLAFSFSSYALQGLGKVAAKMIAYKPSISIILHHPDRLNIKFVDGDDLNYSAEASTIPDYVKFLTGLVRDGTPIDPYACRDAIKILSPFRARSKDVEENQRVAFQAGEARTATVSTASTFQAPGMEPITVSIGPRCIPQIQSLFGRLHRGQTLHREIDGRHYIDDGCRGMVLVHKPLGGVRRYKPRQDSSFRLKVKRSRLLKSLLMLGSAWLPDDKDPTVTLSVHQQNGIHLVLETEATKAWGWSKFVLVNTEGDAFLPEAADVKYKVALRDMIAAASRDFSSIWQEGENDDDDLVLEAFDNPKGVPAVRVQARRGKAQAEFVMSAR